MSELKPCPFCGGEVSVAIVGYGLSANWLVTRGVGGKSCGCRVFMESEQFDKDNEESDFIKDDLVAAWNNRSDGWIPCSERLPEYTDTYNVFCNVGSPFGGFTSVRSYRFERIRGNEPKWCIPNMYEEVVTVTHWQPLPQPPKGEA